MGEDDINCITLLERPTNVPRLFQTLKERKKEKKSQTQLKTICFLRAHNKKLKCKTSLGVLSQYGCHFSPFVYPSTASHGRTDRQTGRFIIIIIHRKIIFPRIMFSVASVIFFFFFFFFGCMFVDTITLERLNQSKPNFHTRLLTGIVRPSSKMGIAGHM